MKLLALLAAASLALSPVASYAQTVVPSDWGLQPGGKITASTGVTVVGPDITFNAASQSIVIDAAGAAGATFGVTGTWSGTLKFQWSNKPTTGFQDGQVTDASGTSTTSITANQQYVGAAFGRYLKITTSALASGSVVVSPMLRVASASSVGGGGGGGGSATAANQTAVQADPGSDAAKAIAVQGCSGCKTLDVAVSGGASAALQTSGNTLLTAISTNQGAQSDPAATDETSTASAIAFLKALLREARATAPGAVKGGEAVDAPLTLAPVVAGCRASTATPTAISADSDVQAIRCDQNGNVIARLAPLPNWVSGVITTPMTVTTSTLLVAAPASGLRNYITEISCVNAHATVDTLVNIQDGSGGTTIAQLSAPHAYGGHQKSSAMIRQPTTATGLYVANVTTGASVTCSASGFKAAE